MMLLHKWILHMRPLRSITRSEFCGRRAFPPVAENDVNVICLEALQGGL